MRIDQLSQFRMHYYDTANQLRDHVYNRSKAAFAKGRLAREAIADKEQLMERQQYIRTAFLKGMGELPGSDSPLEARVTNTLQAAGYRIENIIFESRPGHMVTANFYIPDGLALPGAAVLFLCGHDDNAKQSDEYQTVCQYLVQAGLLVFAMDPIGQGERQNYYEADLEKVLIEGPTTDHEYAGVQSLLLGKPLAGYFLHDAMRALDYLSERAEVDPKRIGVTGNSGGGMQTAMLMLADPRIAAAAPATFIMDREIYMLAGQAQDAEQIWPGFSSHGLDHEDILLAMVPRPVLILAAASDFFPIEGTIRTYERAKKFWEKEHAGGYLQLFVDDSTHQYTVPMAKAAADFFAKHLLKRVPDFSQMAVTLLEHQSLWCTPKGKTMNGLSSVRGIHEENAAYMNELEQLFEKDSFFSDTGLEWLHQQIYQDRVKVELNPRIIPYGHVGNLRMESLFWRSQEGVYNHGFLFQDIREAQMAKRVTIALWEGGTIRSAEHFTWIQSQCKQGEAVFILDVTGTGAAAPNPINNYPILHQFGTLHKLTADLFWLNDSLAAIRVYDLLRAFELLEQLGYASGTISAYAVGRMNFYARLANLVDDRVRLMECGECGESMRELVKSKYYNDYDIYSYLIPGLLRYVNL
ncbi:alpha/beta hydrolase family protein [Paenibacillus eucommiae]|uniref:Acetyl xylan esterase domain-containing protein n=1 Tax=Paenibacillus eucommiae TaxID=1355755 RepID=A0ABS4IWI6_9BACL|nr:prolyl oligopeptidase family serine peptidase [Paenibacillus eucommiae]MBP1991939.1 hypothetical protein [Paenibacillus eucommiae]